jgi:hypothetical protein
MKKYLFILILFAACKSKPKKPAVVLEKTNDSLVLLPPEGYRNLEVQKQERVKDSLTNMQNAAARAMPQPCPLITGLHQTGVTNNTASFAWNNTTARKYYVYKNGSYVGTANTNSYTEPGLLPATTYSFTVVAIGKGNKICVESQPLSITTTNVTEPPPSGGGETNQVIFLQFKPCTITDLNWSSTPIVSPGSGLTEDKQLEVFNYYKSIYSEHPKLSFTMDQAVFDAADPTHRQETVFTTNSSWYGSAGGVSFIGSFNFNKVNWVFSELLNFVARNCAVAGVHEGGHGLGCYHAVDFCGQSYGGALLCSDGLYRAKVMGASYSDYVHYFQTPTRCAGFGVPCITSKDCSAPDEDAIINAHLK